MSNHKTPCPYQLCCKNFLIKRTILLLLQIVGIGEYVAIVIYPTLYVIGNGIPRYGTQMSLLFVFPLFFTVMAVIASLNVYHYGQGLLELIRGDVLIEIGYLTEQSKNIYIISEAPPPHKHTFPRQKTFYLRSQNCTSSLAIGDKIKIIYPCSRLLRVRSSQQLWAIYACSAEWSLDTTITPNAKNAVTTYIIIVTCIAMLLLSITFYLINLLLHQTFLA